MTKDEMCNLENRILDEWMKVTIPNLDIVSLEGESVFYEWWSNPLGGTNKIVLGPIARAKIKKRINQLKFSSASIDSPTLQLNPVNSADEKTELPEAKAELMKKTKTGCPEVLLMPAEYVLKYSSEFCKDDIQEFKPKWFELPGATTLNLPVCSEVIKYKEKIRSNIKRSMFDRIRLYYRRVLAKIDYLLFSLKLWGIGFLWSSMEGNVENALNKFMPYTPIEE